METLLKEPKYSIIPFDWKIWYYILSQFNAKEYYEEIQYYYAEEEIEEKEGEFSVVRLCDVVDWNHEDRDIEKLISFLYKRSVCLSLDVYESIEILTETDINQLLDFVSRVIKAYDDNSDSFTVMSDSYRDMLATVYDEFILAYHIFKCVENTHGYVEDRDDVYCDIEFVTNEDTEYVDIWKCYGYGYKSLDRYTKMRTVLHQLKDLGEGKAFNLDIAESSGWDYSNESEITVFTIKNININKEHGISAYAFLQMLCYWCCRTKQDIADLNAGVHWDESYESYKYYKYQIEDISFEHAHICKDHHYESSKFNDDEIRYFRQFVQRGVFDDAITCYRYTDYEKFIYKVYLAQITNDRLYKLNLLNRCLIDENKYLLSNFYEYYHKYINSPFSFYDEVAPSSMKIFKNCQHQLDEYRNLVSLMDELDTLIWQKTGTQVNSNLLLFNIDHFLSSISRASNDFYSYTQYLYSFYSRIFNDIYEKLRVRIDEIINQNNIYINYISDIIKNEKLYTSDSNELEIQKTDILEDEKEFLDSDAYVSNRNNAIHSLNKIVDKKNVSTILKKLCESLLIRYEKKDNEGKYYINATYSELCEYLIKHNYIYIIKDRLKGYVIEDLIQRIKNKSLDGSTTGTIRRCINWDIIIQLNLYKSNGNGCLTLSDTKGHSSEWKNHGDLLITLLEHYKKEESENR